MAGKVHVEARGTILGARACMHVCMHVCVYACLCVARNARAPSSISRVVGVVPGRRCAEQRCAASTNPSEGKLKANTPIASLLGRREQNIATVVVQFCNCVSWAGLCTQCFSVGGSWFGVVFLVLAVPLLNAFVGAVGGRSSATSFATIFSLGVMHGSARSVRSVLVVHGAVVRSRCWCCFCPMRWSRQGGDPWRRCCNHFAAAMHCWSGCWGRSCLGRCVSGPLVWGHGHIGGQAVASCSRGSALVNDCMCLSGVHLSKGAAHHYLGESSPELRMLSFSQRRL